MRGAEFSRAAAAMALSLLAAGCSGVGPGLSLGGTSATASPKVEASAALSLSPEEVAQSGPAAAFNPFTDVTGVQAGGREVIAQPTMADILAPAGGLPEISIGRADAPVTIVQYASLTCPHCKRFQSEVYPAFKRDYIDTGKVRYILRDFPIGRQSGQGSVAIRCVPADKYMTLYDKFLDQQPVWVSQEVRHDPIYTVAAQVGLTRAAFDACRNDAVLVEGLKAIKDRGRKLGIIGTPNFFVQDKLIKKAVDLPELSGLIEAALRSNSAAAAVGGPVPQ